MRVRKLSEDRPWPFLVGAVVVKPFFFATTSRTWVDGDRIPIEGGCVLVVNHMSHIDPLITAHFVYDHGRIPRYLAKAALFKNRFLGSFLRQAGQIPVERLSRNAVGAYDAAVQAVRDGRCVVIYPEGTLTRDPDLWPMVGKSGAARVALATGCPVIPIGQWGAQRLLAPYAKRPSLFPRKRLQVKVGDPVPLDDLRDQPITPELLAEATERIMAAVTAIVAELRDEPPPATRFDPRAAGVQQIGNPRRKKQS